MPPKAELVWERKFLGFRLDRQGRIGIAPESIERFKQEVREMWRANQSRTSNQLRDDWKSYAKGWWGYYRLAEVRKPFTRLDGWIRRHIRKCFRIRWHSAIGRERALRRLGVPARMLKTVRTGRGGGGWRQPRPCKRRCGTRRYVSSAFLYHRILQRCSKLLGSTAGCGKPHVRWCRRVTGCNPRHPT